MERTALLSALKSVSGTLGGPKSLVPIHPCFCFDGERVFAFDDSAALVTPLVTPWRGGVRGQPMQDWLSAAGAKVVTLDVTESSMKVKCGRASTEFPVLPEEDFIFAPPSLGDCPRLEVTPQLLAALQHVTISMATGCPQPWRNGVQVEIAKGKVVLYSCDDAAASRAVVKMKTPIALRGKDPLLPGRFVELFLAGMKKGGTTSIYLSDEWYAAMIGEGTTLFSAVPTMKNLGLFQGLFSDADENFKAAVPLPKTWFGALKRTSVLIGNMRDVAADCRISGGKMVVEVTTPLGHARDSFKIGKHADMNVKIPPAVAAQCIGRVDRFVLHASPKFCFFDADGSFCFLVAAGS